MVLRRKKSLKRKVTWIPGEKPVVKNYPPAPGYLDILLTESEQAARVPYMRVGTLWRTTTRLGVRADIPGYQPYTMPYLDSTSGHNVYPTKTPAVYMGVVRVEETIPGTSGRGKTSRNTRHCFLVDGVRYLTNNLLDFTPVPLS